MTRLIKVNYQGEIKYAVIDLNEIVEAEEIPSSPDRKKIPDTPRTQTCSEIRLV